MPDSLEIGALAAAQPELCGMVSGRCARSVCEATSWANSSSSMLGCWANEARGPAWMGEPMIRCDDSKVCSSATRATPYERSPIAFSMALPSCRSELDQLDSISTWPPLYCTIAIRSSGPSRAG